jgi:hypothetical protein
MTEVSAATPLRIDSARVRELLAGDPGLLGTEVGVELRRGPVIRQAVAIELGSPQSDPTGTRWSLHWEPVGHTTTLPAFEGVLEVLDGDDGTAVMRLCGSYHPPLGVVGLIVDGVIGHRVAEVSIEHFVGGVARRLDRAAARSANGRWRAAERPSDLRPV